MWGQARRENGQNGLCWQSVFIGQSRGLVEKWTQRSLARLWSKTVFGTSAAWLPVFFLPFGQGALALLAGHLPGTVVPIIVVKSGNPWDQERAQRALSQTPALDWAS